MVLCNKYQIPITYSSIPLSFLLNNNFSVEKTSSAFIHFILLLHLTLNGSVWDGSSLFIEDLICWKIPLVARMEKERERERERDGCNERDPERSSFIVENLFDMKLKHWEFIWQWKQLNPGGEADWVYSLHEIKSKEVPNFAIQLDWAFWLIIKTAFRGIIKSKHWYHMHK